MGSRAGARVGVGVGARRAPPEPQRRAGEAGPRGVPTPPGVPAPEKPGRPGGEEEVLGAPRLPRGSRPRPAPARRTRGAASSTVRLRTGAPSRGSGRGPGLGLASPGESRGPRPPPPPAHTTSPLSTWSWRSGGPTRTQDSGQRAAPRAGGQSGRGTRPSPRFQGWRRRLSEGAGSQDLPARPAGLCGDVRECGSGGAHPHPQPLPGGGFL